MNEEARNHGSRVRIPGVYFRALASTYLESRPKVSRESLVNRLRSRLLDRGIEYDPRSVRRQMVGAIESVPKEVEDELRALAREDLGLTDDELESKIVARGLHVPEELRRSAYVPIERADRLTQLWLHANPGKSKRSLALQLSADLSERGVALSSDSIQSQLAGKGFLVRRDLVEALARKLAPIGVTSVEDAEARAHELKESIDAWREGRALVEAERFRQLSRLWQLAHREVSSRGLAQRLRERLAARRLDVGVHHLQRAIAGNTPRVRADLIEVMEELLAESARTSEHESSGDTEPARGVDLVWVRCEPISELAVSWLQQHPGATMRQLASRVAESIRSMGYTGKTDTLQPIFGGWKKKTRGYVYRALLRQFPGRENEEIPAEHVVGSRSRRRRAESPRSTH